MGLKRPLAAVLAALAVFAAGAVGWPAAAARAEGSDFVVVAGTGQRGFAGDGGPATQAQLDRPGGVAVGPDGTVYISDTGNHRVRAVAPGGTISTVAGTGRVGLPGTRLPAGARGTDVDLGGPTGLAIARDGTLYIADAALSRVLALDRRGRLSMLAGTGVYGYSGDGGPATEARVNAPASLAVAPDGTVYIGDMNGRRVRAVSSDGIITTVAGNGSERVTAAGGVATQVPTLPNSLAVDDHGDVWIAGGGVLQRVSGGRLATVTVPGAWTGKTWTLSDSSTWPPPDPPLGAGPGVAVGSDGIYAVNEARGLERLGAGHALENVATLDSIGRPVPVLLGAAPSGVLYLLDVEGNRVYLFHPPAPQVGVEGGRSTPWWPFAVGGAALVLLGCWLVVWRHSRTRW